VALKWAVREMEERYKKMSKLGVRNIDGYNARVVDAGAKGESLTAPCIRATTRKPARRSTRKRQLELETLPISWSSWTRWRLMMVAGKDIEGACSGSPRWRARPACT